ncbi:hypothetical protein BJ085DRAFT_27944 [Dimargaris cristalligena]|uniref:Uncharacterized protein n=1 Tax=Dimargaris cristalligena TaxID=215637 RepID=A0A4P9ZNT2_9FUNG|nr:hypothetical protein BJ085DRAFT_27944 [Dimargaris cristalligena]|eukprot:RKP33980.1 hypothetical protein BJ085DRAFT_27944 [Dimargaris cristalligena]
MNRADYGRLGLMVMMVTLMLRITVVVMTMMFMMSLRSPIEPVETATAGSLGDVLPIGYDVAGVSGDVDLVTLPVVYAGGLQVCAALVNVGVDVQADGSDYYPWI